MKDEVWHPRNESFKFRYDFWKEGDNEKYHGNRENDIEKCNDDKRLRKFSDLFLLFSIEMFFSSLSDFFREKHSCSVKEVCKNESDKKEREKISQYVENSSKQNNRHNFLKKNGRKNIGKVFFEHRYFLEDVVKYFFLTVVSENYLESPYFSKVCFEGFDEDVLMLRFVEFGYMPIIGEEELKMIITL